MTDTLPSAITVYEVVRKQWGPFSPENTHDAYFAVHALSDIANYLWGALPDKTRELEGERVMTLAQTLRYLGLTIGCLAPDVPSQEARVTWTYGPQLHALLEEAADHALRAGITLEKVRDLVHGVTEAEPTDIATEPTSPPALALANASATSTVTPLIADCQAIFTNLGVQRLPSGALVQALRHMFPDRWASITRANLPSHLPDHIRPQPYNSGKSRYLREHFFPHDTNAPAELDFLPIIAQAFHNHPKDELPVGWLHDQWITRRPDAKHIAITEFVELLRIHGVHPEWTKSGHFVRKTHLLNHIPQPDITPTDSEPTEQSAAS